jgi:hypothetical protein
MQADPVYRGAEGEHYLIGLGTKLIANCSVLKL